MPLTHAYAHLLADVHFGSFAPALPLFQCDSFAPASRRMPIASVVTVHCKKTETND